MKIYRLQKFCELFPVLYLYNFRLLIIKHLTFINALKNMIFFKVQSLKIFNNSQKKISQYSSVYNLSKFRIWILAGLCQSIIYLFMNTNIYYVSVGAKKSKWDQYMIISLKRNIVFLCLKKVVKVTKSVFNKSYSRNLIKILIFMNGSLKTFEKMSCF